METSTNEHSIQTRVATQDDGVIPTQVEASAATQLKQLLLLSCPQFHHAK